MVQEIFHEEVVSENPYLGRLLIPLDGESTKLYENGSLEIVVKNTGSKILGIESVLVSNISEIPESKSFSVLGGESLFIAPGDIRRVSVDVSDVDRNEKFNIVISAINQKGNTAASDVGIINPIIETGLS